ncbi:hypothetical protein PAXRUDRAFT_81139, partial [Paxillus rubicundulus Ve08.2h10]
PRTSRVMTRGHTALHLHIATVNGFPAPGTKLERGWASMKEGVEGYVNLTQKLSNLGKDSIGKEKAVNYVWSAGPQICRELISKAHLKISASYSIPGSMNPKEIAATMEWLICTNAFLNGDLNVKAHTFDKQQLFCHPIIKDLIISQWFGAKGEGVKYPEAFKGVPLPLLALVATAVGFKNVTHIPTYSRYLFYMQKLQRLQKNCPTWYERMTKEMYQAV